MTASFAKKQRERSRQERQREKAQKRQARKAEADANVKPTTPGVDPDIAHIIPGPQPLPDDYEP